MVNLISTLIILILLWVFWKFLWKDYALDCLRESLFETRNDLFNLAYKNDSFGYNDALYNIFEEMINKSIRFGHKINFFQTILFFIVTKAKYPNRRITTKIQVELDRKFDEVKDEKLKEDLMKVKKQFEISIMKYLLKTSILFLIWTIYTFVLSFFSVLQREVQQTLSEARTKTREKLQLELINDIEYQVQNLDTCYA